VTETLMTLLAPLGIWGYVIAAGVSIFGPRIVSLIRSRMGGSTPAAPP
jgi:hypothetical protein